MLPSVSPVFTSHRHSAFSSGEWVASFRRTPAGTDEEKGATVAVNADGSGLRLFGDDAHHLPVFASSEWGGVIFDGVLYNRAELRRDLECGDAPLDDALLLLLACRRWKAEVFNKIKGIYVLISWDRAGDVLLCARDRLGIYPLFCAEAHGELLLSSSIPALLRRPGVSRNLNRAALADRLCYRWPNLDETFFTDLRRVLQGHVLQYDRQGSHVRRYWQPVPPGDTVEWVTEDEVARFEQLMEQAVQRCLTLGPAGIFLSGGLDSVTVAVFASDICLRDGLSAPWGLSVVFPEPGINEELVQKRVAVALGLPQVLTPYADTLGSQGMLLSALTLSKTWPFPLHNPWTPTYMHMALEGKQRGCQVVLTGIGGDEWLLVDPIYGADLFRKFDIAGLYELVKNTDRSYKNPFHATLMHVLWNYAARPLIGEAAGQTLRRAAPNALRARRRQRMLRSRPSWVAPDPELRRCMDHRMDQRVEESMQAPEPGGFYERGLRHLTDFYKTELEMEEYFEKSRRSCTPILHPFWDSDLVQLLCRIPPERLAQNGRTKGLVRPLLSKRLPGLGFEQQKKAVVNHLFRDTLLSEGPGAWQALGGTPTLAKLGLLDGPEFASQMTQIFSGQSKQVGLIFDVLNLEAWLEPRA